MDIDKLLQDQIALVTGANSGIGRGIALAMAEAGAKVVVNYLSNREEAEQVVQCISQKGGTAVSFQADVSCEDQVKKMFSFTCSTFGTLDILVNNAGIQQDADFLNKTDTEDVRDPIRPEKSCLGRQSSVSFRLISVAP